MNGKVFINNLVPTHCRKIKLEVEGKEKAEFTRFWTEYETRTRWVWRNGERHREFYRHPVEKHERMKRK